jgi:ABC-type iron transport system FetAB permease component
MQSKQPSWEGAILAFAMLFTVLLGTAYSLSVVFRIPIPWLAILIISLICMLAMRFRRRLPKL